jgi:hypothetical protein
MAGMATKTFPLSKERLEEAAKTYPTPFYIYDEQAVRENARRINAVFENTHLKVNTQIIIGDDNPNYSMPMVVNGITIETDGFEVLSIDKQDKYDNEQLKIFDYDIEYNVYVLKNYSLKTIIPMNIIEKHTGKMQTETLYVEINNKNGRTTRILRILGKEIAAENYDILGAFEKLYNEVNKEYIIKICAFCKNSCWNPYGGTDFYHHLCFKEFADEYCRIDIKDKMNIVRLMEKNKGKYNNVYLTNYCDEYMEKDNEYNYQ